MMTRVFLADDEAKVRSALRLLLEQALDLAIVGEAAQAQGLLCRVEAAQPDLLVIDWELPGLQPAELFPALRATCSRPKIVALSGNPGQRHGALAAGVDAFACKSDSPAWLIATLQATIQDPLQDPAGDGAAVR